jgi:electron transfer flavoprotein beta subunit
MLIVVCVKQVPASNDVEIDPVTKNLRRDSAEGVMNPFDKNAVEAGLTLREKCGGRVLALSMGPPQFMDTLREAVAMGCDEAVLLSSRALGGADTLATAYTLAKAVEKIEHVDLILFGRHAVDADTGQVGPLVAEFLDLPQVTLAKDLDTAEEGWLAVTRLLDKSEEKVEVRLPAVVTVCAELNKPRYPTPIRIMKAARLGIPLWNENDLACDPERIGLQGSRTVVSSIFAPPKPERAAEMLGGPGGLAGEAAARLVDILINKNLL